MGSSLGLIAILAGALFNAYLNRKRDDLLRYHERDGVRTALIGELTGLRVAFNNMADELEKNAANDAPSSFFVPGISSSVRVMPLLLAKFGLLPADAIRQVIEVYAIIEQFRPTLLLIGGTHHADHHPGHVVMLGGSARPVAEIGRNAAKRIDAVIATLSAVR